MSKDGVLFGRERILIDTDCLPSNTRVREKLFVSGGQARNLEGGKKISVIHIVQKNKTENALRASRESDFFVEYYRRQERTSTQAATKLQNQVIWNQKTLAGNLCPYCHKQTKDGFLLDHQQICPKIKIPCPLGCTQFFPREELSSHYDECESYMTRCLGHNGRWCLKRNVFVDYHVNCTRLLHLQYQQLKSKGSSAICGDQISLLSITKDVRNLIYYHLTSVSPSTKFTFVDDALTTIRPLKSLPHGCSDYFTLMLLSLTCRSIYDEIHRVNIWSIGILSEVKKIEKPTCPCCGVSLYFGGFEKHFESCPKNIISCPYCVKDFQRLQMMEHLKEHDGYGIAIHLTTNQLVIANITSLVPNI